ncbi:HNH endonuclease signature motif containing protein [Cryobacterium sp. MLB-32]|uniref:HNH endonuclease signature motif containing protein n=1 Tax=Cryobacterium sp. MLB-32 TaxID=1529318 RepID=UPI00068F7D7F|nr:HNH endonuclease signature motif containing protein [Cryobacterium sp. MLB-32]
MENTNEVPPPEDAAGSSPPEPVDLTPEQRAVVDTQLRLLDAVKEHDRAICAAQAARAAAVDEIVRWTRATAETGRPTTAARGRKGYVEWSSMTAAHEGLVAELACLLTLPENCARNLMCHSELLQHKLPATRAALTRGDISYRHVEIIIDNVLALPDEAWQDFEREALTESETLTVPQFTKKAIRIRELTHPESIAVRHKRALADRCFFVGPGRDGMAYLEMTLSNEDASAIRDRVEAMAKNLQSSSLVEPVETRTLPQLRTDVAVDLLLGGVTATGLGAGIRGNVYVTVPVLTLMGKSEEPGTLEGFGPIDPETARRIAGTASSFTRILIHPETGAVLSFGRTKYKVPTELRRWLQLRDGSCRAAGCNRRAQDCDIDHTIPWESGGETVFSNLANLCKRSHRVKHETGWAVEQGADGTLNWTSPAGKHYATHPATRIRPTVPTTEPAAKPNTWLDVWSIPNTGLNTAPF